MLQVHEDAVRYIRVVGQDRRAPSGFEYAIKFCDPRTGINTLCYCEFVSSKPCWTYAPFVYSERIESVEPIT